MIKYQIYDNGRLCWEVSDAAELTRFLVSWEKMFPNVNVSVKTVETLDQLELSNNKKGE